MAEYIDREDLIAKINTVMSQKKYAKGSPSHFVFELFTVVLKGVPTADVVEVKHGEWIVLAKFADKSICTECSVCGEEYTYKMGRIGDFVHSCYAKYNYCPNCGVKMDLKGSGEE